MRRLSKFFKLSTADQLLLLESVAQLAIVRVALRVIGYSRTRDWLRRRLKPHALQADPSKVVWAAKVSAKLLPGALCLAQALTLQYMLARSGRHSVVRIGVAGEDAKLFSAHAWVIYEDRVVLGHLGSEQARYTTLTDLRLTSP